MATYPVVSVGQSFVAKVKTKREGEALPLTGATGLSVKLKKPSGDDTDVDPVVTDADGGGLDIPVDQDFNDELGTIRCQITGVDADGFALCSNIFRIRVLARL